MNSYTPMGIRVGRGVRNAVLVVAAVAATACNKFLEVENPNNVGDESLGNPAAAGSIVNGAGGATMRALNSLLAPYGAVTDELVWSGSRDAFKQLDDGGVSDPSNEYVDAASFQVSEARYLTEESIQRLLGFQKAGKLTDANDLARAYMFAAVMFRVIPDMYDDYVISSFRTDNGDPVGEANMGTLYDKAIDYATKGLALATDNTTKANLTAMRASARFNKAIWAKLNPGGAAPAQPLVNDAAAATDAAAAYALMTGLKYRFDISPSATASGNPSSGFEINQRLELAGGDRFVVRTTAGTRVASIRMVDPITNQADPILSENVERCCKVNATFNTDGNFIPFAVTSGIDMQLIIAEVALANNQMTTFATAINTIRTAYGLPDWTSASTVSASAILQHERSVGLFMQGRRLADLYRFNLKSDRWTTTSDAGKRVGCFFSISITERQSNAKVTAQPTCRQS
ncbi:MAG: RagB/SusD family nutrient uptake outer membrane protein [Gemmatimonadaceae bacterium]|nr:RagB/SusD family nutrient uptake outer membrane protein [Gemmatimonadaceae bacterium]